MDMAQTELPPIPLRGVTDRRMLCHLQLCSEDYCWWWRSFLTSGSTAFYVMVYSTVYFSRLEPDVWLTCVGDSRRRASSSSRARRAVFLMDGWIDGLID